MVCVDSNGHPYLVFGSDTSEDDARQKGIEMNLGDFGDFEVRCYPTRDRSEASALFRGKRLANGEGIDKARERIGHEKSLARLQDRVRQRADRRRKHTSDY